MLIFHIMDTEYEIISLNTVLKNKGIESSLLRKGKEIVKSLDTMVLL